MSKSYISPNGTTLLIDLHLPSKDSVGMYPLHWAITEGAIPVVSMLLQHLEERPSPPKSRQHSSSSLMEGNDNENDVHNTDNNVGIDAKDSSGCTPLLIAAQYGHPDLAAFLIQRGADATAVDSSRDTALHWAAYKGSVEVCGMLLHLQGVEGHLDGVDKFGQTPLHLASLRGNVETVRFLLEEAASVSAGAGSGGYQLEQGSAMAGRVGSKLTPNNRVTNFFPGKLLTTKDKDGKTPMDLAIKKKKEGCIVLLHEYQEQYLAPKRSCISRIGKTCKDLCSVRNWKAWMGMGGTELPIGQSPTFPFYWMTSHLLMACFFYATEFVGIGSKRRYGDDGLLWDRIGLHIFFMISIVVTWITLYYTWKTNPGVLDARGTSSSSTTTPTCQFICCDGREHAKDKISVEMEIVTKELRRQYDEVIGEYGMQLSFTCLFYISGLTLAFLSCPTESFSKDFPSEDKRIPLSHTCRIVKPLRSKHCRVARRCVLLFDHHCPFVGTTVGLYNYIYFYLFLVFFLLAEIGFITALVIFLSRSKSFPKGIFLLGSYISLYAIPVAMMVFYHTQLVLNNISTNEQLNARKYSYFWDHGRFYNPFDNGKIRNILQRLSPDRSSYELTRHNDSTSDEERLSMLSNIV